MAIIYKEKRDDYVKILKYKTEQLLEILEGRDLESNKEMAGEGKVWQNPDKMVVVDTKELRDSIEYFKQELNSILEYVGGL